MTSRIRSVAALALAALLLTPAASFAGPPLICFPFDIGAEAPLPWAGGTNWNAPDPRYDVRRLTGDTIRALGAKTPVLVRMETLRRATIYASHDPKTANELLAAILARAASAMTAATPDPFAIFDAGYLIESYKQAAHMFKDGLLMDASPRWTMRNDPAGDGYQLVRRALQLTNGHPDMEFAASLMRQGAEAAGHRQRAMAGVNKSPLLARNIHNR